MPKLSKSKRVRSFDVDAGNMLRSYRNHFGVSQAELGDKLGVTFQQIQKYEKGTNRISFGRAVQICAMWKLDIREFAGLNGQTFNRSLDNIDFKLMEEINQLEPAIKGQALTLLRAMNHNAKRKKQPARGL